MPIQSEINILANAISNIKTEIRNKGQSVAATDTVASLPNKIDKISNKNGLPYAKNVLTQIVEGTIENLYDEVLDYIRPYCFSGCNKLKTAYFTNLKKICPHAFDNCYMFNTLILSSQKFVYLENINAFKGTPLEKRSGVIYVTDSLINEYLNDAVWAYYSSIIKRLSNYQEG